MIKTPFNKLGFLPAIALVLLLVMSANIAFGFVLIPAKEAKAAQPVVDVAWNPFSQIWKAIQTGLQKIGNMFSGITAAVKLWEQSESILHRIIAGIIQTMLYKLLTMVTNDIIKWINGGEEPKFVTDWAGFLRDAAFEAGGIFVSQLGLDFLCQPFAPQIKLALMPAPYMGSGSSGGYGRCTLDSMGANLSNFFNDFATGGGWDTWLQIIQPQNNFYGSYLMALDEKTRRELEAAQAAQNKALSGGGILGAEECVQCRVENLLSGQVQILSGDACKTAESSGEASVVCLQRKIKTPGTIVQHEIQQAVDSGRQMIQNTISSMTAWLPAELKMLTPFLQAIFAALINRSIQFGLDGLTGIGTSNAAQGSYYQDSYYYDIINNSGAVTDPSQTGSNTPDISTLSQISQDMPVATQLADQQGLLLENLQTELLPAEQKKDNLLQQIASAQEQVLNTLAEIVNEGCSLPSWASQQLLSTQTTGNTVTETYLISTSGIGSIRIQKTTTTITTSTSTYEVLELTTQTVAGAGLAEVNQWITDTQAAITATENYITEAENYQSLYQSTNNSNTLSQAAADVQQARDAMVSAAQKAAKSTSTDLYQLMIDTQEQSVQVLEKAANIENSLEGYQSQLNSVQQNLSEAQSTLNACVAAQQQPAAIKLWD